MEVKGSDRREIIIAAAKTLFWKHGFRRVSVEEICEKSEISKMTFYRYFPNKIELAKTVFSNAVTEGYRHFQSIMNENSTAENKIHKILLMKFEGTNEISMEFLTDFYSGKEAGLNDYVKTLTNEIWQDIISDLRIAQHNGIFRQDLNLEFFFYISQKIMDLLNDPKISGLFNSPQEMIMETAKLLMYGISPQK